MYCQKADLEKALRDGVLADWTGGNDLKVNAAIASAASEINGYLLSGGYTVPLSVIPDNVRDYAVSVSLYNLAVVRGITEEASDKELIEKKKAAIRFFEGVATGKFRIPTGQGSGEESPTRPTGKFKVLTGTKMNMNGFC